LLAHGYLEAVAEDLRIAETIPERVAAARNLGQIGSRFATAHLIAALYDDDGSVRRAAVEALAVIGDPTAVAPLKELIGRETDPAMPVSVIHGAIIRITKQPRVIAPVTDEASHSPLSGTVSSKMHMPAVEPSPVEHEAAEVVTSHEAVSAATETEREAGEPEGVRAEADAGVTQVEFEVIVVESEATEAWAEVTEDKVSGREMQSEDAPSEPEAIRTELDERPVALQASEPAVEPAAAETVSTPALTTPKPSESAAPVEAVEKEPAAAEAATDGEEQVDQAARRQYTPGPDEVQVRTGVHAVTFSDSEERPTEDDRQFQSVAETLRRAAADLARKRAEEAFLHGKHGNGDELPQDLKLAEVATEVVTVPPEPDTNKVTTQSLDKVIDEVDLADRSRKLREEVEALQRAAGDQRERLRLASTREAPAEPTLEEQDRLRPAAARSTISEPTLAEQERLEAERRSRANLEREALQRAREAEAERQSEAAKRLEAEAEARLRSEKQTRMLSDEVRSFWLEVQSHLGPEETGPAREERSSRRIEEVSWVEVKTEVTTRLPEEEELDDTEPRATQPSAVSEAAPKRAEVTTDDSFAAIAQAFDDPSADVRSAAARALSTLSGDRTALFARVFSEAQPDRRSRIAAALVASGLAAEAVDALAQPGEASTHDAGTLLLLMARAGEVYQLARAVEEHPSMEVRLSLVRLLKQSGQQSVVDLFRRMALSASLPIEVRSAVMEAIYELNSAE
jgi:HEAT repeat protein